MATISKFSVKGFRSFGFNDEDEQQMDFSSPLTLVLGDNGSGKTTVMEALRFGLIGETGAKEKTFIHDLGVTSSKVEARVQLMAVDKDENPSIECERSVVKKLVKNKETLLYDCEIRKGNEVKRFTKFNEMKAASDVMTRFVGISQALLDYVVFCHQNDSCWPLELDSGLKQRFDGIFGLNHIEKAINQTMKDIKEKEGDLANVQKNKLVADERKTFVEYQTKSLTSLENDISKLNDQIKNHDAAIEGFDEKLEHFKKFEDELEQANAEKATCDERIRNNEKQVESLELGNLIKTEPFSDDESLEPEERHLEAKRRRLNTPGESLKDISDSTQVLKYDIEEDLKRIDDDLLRNRLERNKAVCKQKFISDEKEKKLSIIDKTAMKVRELCGEGDFEEVIKRQENKMEKLRSTHSNLEAMQVIFGGYVDHLKQKSCCKFCCTEFEPKEQMDLLKTKTVELQDLPRQVEESATKLKHANEEYDKLLKLKPLLDESNALAKENERFETDMMRLKTEIDEKNIKINSLEGKKRMNKVQLASYLRSELDETNEKSQNAAKLIDDLKGFLTEKRVLTERKNCVSKSRSELTGKQNGLKESLSKVAVALSEEKYKNAIEVFKKACEKEKMIEDEIKKMQELRTNLEREQLSLHNEKMTKVNETIECLWSTVYRGGDIENIRIHSFDENRVIDGDKRRSYDYRVKQIRNGVESDMKNRCSAGQKILASLIIRLALAKTFKCSFIALDEPTANLDDSNMNALSEALRNFTASEREEKFSLIVMSHNINFIKSLEQDEYYKLNRTETGKSRITKNSFNLCA